MPLSWNEIKSRAITFSKEWEDEYSEDAEAKSFWDGFFHIFGISRRRVASFEEPVKKLGDKRGYIDLFWKGIVLVEHKSRGKNLDTAYRQALDYFPGIKERDLPSYILVSDFASFRLYDLEGQEQHEFNLKDLHKNIKLFGFIAGYQKQRIRTEIPVDIEAAEKMGRLHDQLKEIGYEGHQLEVYLVRLLFCMFAEDSGIFERQIFQDYIQQRTSEDGSDLAYHISAIFQVLNTPEDKRLKNLDEQLAAFPFVNGKLFEELLPNAHFDSAMRQTLIDCCALDWSRISPAIFGSLFQSIMDKAARRNLGAHYTSEENILKLIQPLFLDDLWKEFHSIKSNRKKLKEFHEKLRSLKFLDPACGCGNFLVIAYRALRVLELEILKKLHKKGKTQQLLDISSMVKIDVDQFYGIEIEEFPAQIAQVALWLMDHQMNMIVSQEFGLYFVRIPLRTSGTILCANALQIDWNDVVPASELSYIMGNPPFVGAKFLKESQKKDTAMIFEGIKKFGLLDYVCAWYVKATKYIEDYKIKCAFVSTNSISQGEQVGVLWEWLLDQGINIFFAHRTFQWNSEARGKAAVHCVIIGFSKIHVSNKLLFDYQDIKGEPQRISPEQINPYLVDAPTILLANRKTPISSVPKMGIGNKPIDGGSYLFTENEMKDFLLKEPQARPYFKRWLGADEFLNGYERYCLWLGDCSPEELKRMPMALRRIEQVKALRLASKSAGTRKLAETPTRFHVENMPVGNYLIVPEVSSERRTYLPIGFEGPDTFCSNLVKIVPEADLYHFGILSSLMHNAWMRAVAGRLESRYRYSVGIVYNNFPWPAEPTDKQVNTIKQAAQGVLEARSKYPGSSLANLYDPLLMPSDLVKAHRKLDRAVDNAYGQHSLQTEADRVAFLFGLYQEYLRGER